jgi:signal transduction histidine kinase
MPQSFRDIPIKRKVTLVIMIASMTTLLVASVSLFVFQWLSARHTIMRDLQAQAEIIESNSTAALTFQDQKAATEMLSALKAKPHILAASLYLPDGSRLAVYGEEDLSPATIQNPVPEGLNSEGLHLLLYRPVMLDNRRLGTLHLRFDFRAMEREIIKPFLLITSGIVMVALLLAIVLSSAFQRVISAPLLRLTATARTVADRKDYSVRADPAGQDEIGTLTQAFNQMLTRIQEQDDSLRAAGERYQKQHETLTTLTRGEALYADDVDATLRRLCETAAQTLQVARVSVWRWNEARTTLGCLELYELSVRCHSAGQEIAAADYPDYVGALNGSEIIAADHARSDPRTHELKDGYLSPLGITSLLDAPINLNGQVIGVLCHEHVGPARSWHPDEKMFAISMSNLVSMTFAHWERRQTQTQLDEANQRLIETSRLAGMAEVATGVLHNVGNVLNSVNVSCTLVLERVRQSKVANLPKLAAMIQAQDGGLGQFLTFDPKGKQIPGYLCALAPILVEEQAFALKELHSLRDRIDHIKEIVAMQQSYARISGVTETIAMAQLVEDAVKLNTGALARHGVQVEWQFEPVPLICTDKHKVLQILLNLIHNAKYACDTSQREPKLVTLRVFSPQKDRVGVQVTDNGVGIPPENLTRIFAHGFTTRKNGHGFGLHSGALAARELGGFLQAESAGLGQGATFTLELPLNHQAPL